MSSSLLTIQDVADCLRLGKRTIYAMASEGELPAFKVRGQWRIRREDFEQWLSEQPGKAESLAGRPSAEAKKIGAPGSIKSAELGTRAEQVSELAEEKSDTTMEHLTKRIPHATMHQHLIDVLGPDKIRSHGPLERKPLVLDLVAPLPQRIRLYLFNATRPPGGRPLGEHKIQLIIPGQGRKERGNFDHGDGRIVLLAGYSAEEDVFVFWDAGLYSDFAWSRNVQVKVETIIRASAGKIATQERRLRPRNAPGVTEVLVAARADRLDAAILKRIQLTRERMLRE